MTGGALHLGAAAAESKAVCVFVHGRGQSPEDMERDVIRRLNVAGVAYVLPRAPGGAWYKAKAVDPYTEETRRELDASLALLDAAVRRVPAGKPMVLAGFSQGACLVIEHALKSGAWNGSLLAFTGCRVGGSAAPPSGARLEGMPVYLSGSDADSWIPVGAWAAAAECFARAGARLTAACFPGRPHEIGAAEFAVLDGALRGAAA